MPDPTGYGRVVRDGDGVAAVVEHKDADDRRLTIDEIATSVYAFDGAALREALAKVGTDNAQGEQYLTDVVALHRGAGLPVHAHVAGDADETRGVNDRAQLADLARVLRDRIVRQHQLAGVAVLDPQTTWIDSDVVLEPDVTIAPHCQLHGSTVVRSGAVIGPDTTLTDCDVAPGATVLKSHCVGARIGTEATVGPFSYLRPGTVLGARAKVGAFVETKAAEHRRRRQGPAPVLRRGRHHRRAQQHRRGHDRGQLRRAGQAPYGGRCRRPDRQQQHVGRPSGRG